MDPFGQEKDEKNEQQPRQIPRPKNKPRKSKHEVADILWNYTPELLREGYITKRQRKIVENIKYCRTEEMGGHCSRCNNCDHFEISYNSCRDQHCPKCQSIRKSDWLEARQKELLPVEYAHSVFTLPHILNDLILCNKKILLKALFKAVKDTLFVFASDPQYGLVGQLGFTAVLHTWERKLNAHFHLHCVIPAGVLDEPNQQWIQAKYKFLFPVTAMSKVFRGKYLELLKQARKEGELEFPGKTEYLAKDESFAGLLLECYSKEWVVYSKRPFKSPKHVFDYLGRYTHKVAISNHRIISTEAGRVKFKYFDRETGQEYKVNLTTRQFVSRFLLHTLPSGFAKIRHFGFLD